MSVHSSRVYIMYGQEPYTVYMWSDRPLSCVYIHICIYIYISIYIHIYILHVGNKCRALVNTLCTLYLYTYTVYTNIQWVDPSVLREWRVGCRAAEHCAHSKEPHIHRKDPHIHGQESYTHGKETYIHKKET